MNKQPVSVRSLFGFPIVRGIGRDYTIPQVDLSAEPDGIQPLITVDGSRPYLGHPDSILTKTGEILTFFPAGHGRGAVLGRISGTKLALPRKYAQELGKIPRNAHCLPPGICGCAKARSAHPDLRQYGLAWGQGAGRLQLLPLRGRRKNLERI